MLYTPTTGSDTAFIVGIDPGSENLGFASIEFNLDDFSIVSTRAQTFTGSKLMVKNSWLIESRGERVARINALRLIVYKKLEALQPIQVVCESPFYNPRRPMAYGVLIEVMLALKEVTYEHDPWRELYLIDPPTVKKCVGAAGNADKVKVKEAVLALPGLNYDGYVPLQDLDEHSIDAIAVAYSKYVDLIKNKPLCK